MNMLRDISICCIALLALPGVSEERASIALQGTKEGLAGAAAKVSLAGVTVTPHVRATGIMTTDKGDGMPLGARIQFFVRNDGTKPEEALTLSEATFDGNYPLGRILKGEWSWHDTPNLWPEPRSFPPGTLSVWTINAVQPTWQNTGRIVLGIEDWDRGVPIEFTAEIKPPARWVSAVTFLGQDVHPDRMIIHIANTSNAAVRVKGARLWLPKDNDSYRILYPTDRLRTTRCLPEDKTIPAGEKGVLIAETDPLPLTYTALEVQLEDEAGGLQTLWSHVRIKREVFDISGGWVDGPARDGRSTLLHEPFLKVLKRLYVNTGHIGIIKGYNDTHGESELYKNYPIKQFGALRPLNEYDQDKMLPLVHGAELLGEPQLPFSNGGVLPQQVFKEFAPYASTRIPTTITLNDEATFRYYAGLSDYPHYDAYRVIAPAVDIWTSYDRWAHGVRIGWGAPLEGIGELCRVLREMSRPAPTAVWSQGPADGWYEIDGRMRFAPTPDELRLQAYHALSSRITSMYWFNLNLQALVRYRDTLDEITRIGRETRMLESFYLEGDAYQYKSVKTPDGKYDWDLASIVSPSGSLLFALDLAYEPNTTTKSFEFGPPRAAQFDFTLPAFAAKLTEVFRVDADGTHDVKYELTGNRLTIRDTAHKVAIYVAATTPNLRRSLDEHRRSLEKTEQEIGFDPAANDRDFAVLSGLARE